MHVRASAGPSAVGTESFFLWGPRQTGKTTLLRKAYPDARWIDLLKADEFRRYAARPERLREELDAEPPDPRRQVVIDEIQKVPALLDEVHWLNENRHLSFALCGSSARKVRRGAANLLGGRAVRYELLGLTAGELGREFDLDRMLNHGYLPRSLPVRPAQAPARRVRRRLPQGGGRRRGVGPQPAGLLGPSSTPQRSATPSSSTSRASAATVASRATPSEVTSQILEDTLLGRWLPAYRKRPKRRVIGAPKFYFSDVGVVNHLSLAWRAGAGSELYGKAFENWVMHELSAFVRYREVDGELSYWRLASGVEVDFVLGDMRLAIEAKSSERVTSDHLAGLRTLVQDHPRVRRRIVVCREPRARRTEDGIEILPASVFVQRLWTGELG